MNEEDSNFYFLKLHDPIFFQLAYAAERAFSSDPNTTLIKLRQLGEAMTQELAVLHGVYFDEMTKQVDLIYDISREMRLDPTVRQLFHTLRVEGNRATHQFHTQHKEALDGLKVARTLAAWFHKALGKAKANFKLGAFVPPKDPSERLRLLRSQVVTLKQQLSEADKTDEEERELIELLTEEKKEYQQLAEMMDKEAKTLAKQAQTYEDELLKQQVEFEQNLKQIRKQLEQNQEETQRTLKEQIRLANRELTMNEELARIIVDQQLNQAGWEADTQEMTYIKGCRPEHGKNKAISQWPCNDNQWADYILFMGLTPVAVIEAEQDSQNMAGLIKEAERYAKSFDMLDEHTPAWSIEDTSHAWKDYKIPFVYSSNGRAYNRKIKEKSGTWFRDTRKSSNISRALESFHAPEGISDLLKSNVEKADSKLSQEDFSYLGLRDYQEKAIRAVEETIASGEDKCLISMATGTGKTRTILGLMYRFLKAKRFKKILLLVDKASLGLQAQEAFIATAIEHEKSLAELYEVSELNASTSSHIKIATIDEMIEHCFYSEEKRSVDEYDCIIVDEAHRCYVEHEELLESNSKRQGTKHYRLNYNHVLNYFDAVKIGLSATSAKYITEIFGPSQYTYSYREAIADAWLVDQAPPIHYKTSLSENGIHFTEEESVTRLDSQTGELTREMLGEAASFSIADFNRSIIAPGFNEAICNQLAKEIDPTQDSKTIIFCTSDLHADMIKNDLDQAFSKIHGEFYDETSVAKITKQSDDVDSLVQSFKNETYPNIAITVDLLTTGIDVPKVAHLVFLRKVRSRILFEQMIGRATRRCDAVGKQSFRIYDAVDLYSSLESDDEIAPLTEEIQVTNPIVFEQEDKLVSRQKFYGKYESSQDFLMYFHDFLQEHVRNNLALNKLAYNPGEMTRQDLKEARLFIDKASFSESLVRAAWENQTRHQINASLIDFIRKGILGEEMKNFDERVTKAMDKVFLSFKWTPVQKRWLVKLAILFEEELCLDPSYLDQLLSLEGGFRRFDKILNGEAKNIIETVKKELWS